MEKKYLRKTDGAPFMLGMAAGVVLLLGTILSVNLKDIETQATLSAMKLPVPATGSGAVSTGGLIGTIITFLIYPGIFLLLLLLGKNKEKRGGAFAVVWMVISILSIIMSVVGTVMMKNVLTQISAAVDTVMPGGYLLQNGLEYLGQFLVVASCILFLKRLHEPPKPEKVHPESGI